MDPLADKVIARCCIEMGQMHRYKQTTQTHTQPHIHPHFTHMWLSSDRRVLSGITHTHTHTHFTHLWLSSDRRVLSAIKHSSCCRMASPTQGSSSSKEPGCMPFWPRSLHTHTHIHTYKHKQTINGNPYWFVALVSMICSRAGLARPLPAVLAGLYGVVRKDCSRAGLARSLSTVLICRVGQILAYSSYT